MSDTSTTTIIRPEYCAGSYGEILNDFRENVSLSVEEMDKIIYDHRFTQHSLEETHRLFKFLWNYQVLKNNTSQPKVKTDEV